MISVREVNNVVVLDLSGQFVRGDAIDAYRLKVHDLVASGKKNLAINLAGVTFMDSSGIGALVGSMTTADSAGAKCRFFAPSKRVNDVLKLVHLLEVLRPHETEAAALSSFQVEAAGPNPQP